MMRQQFIPNIETAQQFQFVETGADDEQEVWDMCPWAAVVLPCEGGWQAFESVSDADIWCNQA